MDLGFSAELLALLFAVAMIAGIIDTLAGGGGLIVLPVLLIAQIPPLNALATNKLQGACGTLTASLTLLRKRAISWQSIKVAFFASLIGSAMGTIIVHFIDTQILEWCIPVVLIVIAGYFLLSKQVGHTETQSKMSERQFNSRVVPAIGFYDGVLGPGTGSFFSFANVALRGKTITQATIIAKTLNLASNVASLVVFIASGKILWVLGITMALGQIVGASIGSRLILSNGQQIIRPLIITTCLSMCTYYVYLLYME